MSPLSHLHTQKRSASCNLSSKIKYIFFILEKDKEEDEDAEIGEVIANSTPPLFSSQRRQQEMG